MEEAKHTPGPWIVTNLRGHCPHVAGAKKRDLICRCENIKSWGENEANARLIAAAPELLAALIDMVQENQSELTAEHYAHARSAIAKAEGR